VIYKTVARDISLTFFEQILELFCMQNNGESSTDPENKVSHLTEPVNRTSHPQGSAELSVKAMMSYIVDYSTRVLTDNVTKSRAILDIVYYEEKDSISSPGNDGDNEEYTLINLDKIKNKDNIKAIYNIIYKIVESLKENISQPPAKKAP
jgi:hypothetical protein